MHPLPAPLADHAPMSTFRGAPLTHEVAEDMLIGWMDPGRGSSPFSWLVAAGKNPHQLFSRGKGRGQMWYEPVFKGMGERKVDTGKGQLWHV
eukprot:1160675-Pelagomonas_calceolata.AAC.21